MLEHHYSDDPRDPDEEYLGPDSRPSVGGVGQQRVVGNAEPESERRQHLGRTAHVGDEERRLRTLKLKIEGVMSQVARLGEDSDEVLSPGPGEELSEAYGALKRAAGACENAAIVAERQRSPNGAKRVANAEAEASP